MERAAHTIDAYISLIGGGEYAHPADPPPCGPHGLGTRPAWICSALASGRRSRPGTGLLSLAAGFPSSTGAGISFTTAA